MSIDDDYMDIEETLRESDVSGSWDRFANHVAHLECENDELIKQNNELKTAIRVMMNGRMSNEH